MKKSIVFVNQSSGYLMIDIINAHAPYYDELILLTGFLNPRETPLDENVKVHRLIEYKRSSSLKRLLTWMLFWFQSWYYIFLKYRESKLYFVSNPPLNTFSANWTKRGFAFLIYDIYPDALVKNGIISEKSWLFTTWMNVNQKVYKKGKRLFTLSKGMKKAMNLLESDKDKMEVVPVWTNNQFFKAIEKKDNAFIKQEQLEHKFIISYSGNLGKTHPVDKLIDLAEHLVDQKDICVLIIGEGDRKKQLLERQAQLRLPNLKILDFQPTAFFPHVLAAADIGVVTLEANAADLSVPSKTYNLMSAGKPILSIAKDSSELAQLVSNNAIGSNFDEGDIEGMRNFILSLKNDKKRYEEICQNALNTSLKYSPENAKKMILK